jgi:Thioredoxin-like
MLRTLTAIGLLCPLPLPAWAGEPVSKPPSAQSLFDVASSRAREEGKPVFLICGADGCQPCRRFDAYHGDAEVRRVLDRHLVLVKVDTTKNPGAREVMKRLGEPHGVPAWGLLDPSGNKVDGTPSRWGYAFFPSDPESRAKYLSALRTACPNLSDAEATLLERKLKESPGSVESRAARKVENAADAKLTFAKELLRSGKRASAATRLEQIVKDCGGTRAAAEAAQLLKSLPP